MLGNLAAICLERNESRKYSCGFSSMGSTLRYLCRKAKPKLRLSDSGETIPFEKYNLMEIYEFLQDRGREKEDGAENDENAKTKRKT